VRGAFVGCRTQMSNPWPEASQFPRGSETTRRVKNRRSQLFRSVMALPSSADLREARLVTNC
jgi:hypothetical protein